MANKIMTTTIFLQKMAKLYTKYGILMRDMIYQEELFEFQEEMANLLLEFYNKNETISPKTMKMFKVFSS